MESRKRLDMTRRHLLRAGIVGMGAFSAAALAGCGETQIVEVIKEVPVEKIVTQIVEKAVIQEKIVTVEVASPKPQAFTLIFASWWALESGGFGLYEQKYIDLFQATYPHITLEYRNWPWSEFHTKMLTQAAAGTAPDAFAQSNVFYPKYIKRGGALALDEYIKSHAEVDMDDFLPISLKLSSVDGKLYGFPHISSAWATLYNKETLEAAGVASPNDLDAKGEWNWDSQLEMLKQLTKRDSSGKAETIGMGDPGLRFRSSHQWLWQNGGNALKQGSLDEFVMNSDESAAAVQWIADLVNVHKVAAGLGDVLVNDRGDMNQGRIGMIQTWANFSNHKGFPVDVVYPAAGPAERVTNVHTNSLGVSSKTKYPEAALDYIALKTSKIGDRDQVEFGMGIVLRKSNLEAMTKISKNDFGVDHAEVIEEVIATGRVFDVNEFHQETIDTVNPFMEEIRDGAPAKEKLDEVKPLVDEILAPMRS